MQILNVGPLEFIFIVILALLLLGPDRMVSSARSLGKWVYRLLRSPLWTSVMDTSREIRDLPNKIVREAGLEESLKEIRELNREIGKAVDSEEVGGSVRDMNDRIRQAANLANQERLKNLSEGSTPEAIDNSVNSEADSEEEETVNHDKRVA